MSIRHLQSTVREFTGLGNPKNGHMDHVISFEPSNKPIITPTADNEIEVWSTSLRKDAFSVLHTGAIYGEGGLDSKYRHLLWWVFDDTKPLCTWIMLNPSTATHDQTDPTIKRCLGFARNWDFGGIVVANLFPYRATDPEDMKKAEHVLGEGLVGTNILCSVFQEMNSPIICGWGNHGEYKNRDCSVLKIASVYGAELFHLGQNKNGTPKHPLYLSQAAEAKRFREV